MSTEPTVCKLFGSCMTVLRTSCHAVWLSVSVSAFSGTAAAPDPSLPSLELDSLSLAECWPLVSAIRLETIQCICGVVCSRPDVKASQSRVDRACGLQSRDNLLADGCTQGASRWDRSRSIAFGGSGTPAPTQFASWQKLRMVWPGTKAKRCLPERSSPGDLGSHRKAVSRGGLVTSAPRHGTDRGATPPAAPRGAFGEVAPSTSFGSAPTRAAMPPWRRLPCGLGPGKGEERPPRAPSARRYQ